MDPDACLARFLEALTDDDREEALAALDDLREWIKKGGFLPGRQKPGDGPDDESIADMRYHPTN